MGQNAYFNLVNVRKYLRVGRDSLSYKTERGDL